MDRAYKLETLAEAVRGELLMPSDMNLENITISDIKTDSREDLKSCIFLAIKGEATDGHQYLEQAVKQGASALIIHDRDLANRYRNQIPVVLVADTKHALEELAHFYREDVKNLLITVSGSVGKTSTRDAIACALEVHGKTHKTKNNINNIFGVPYSILAMPEDADYAVIEVAAGKPGAIQRMSYTTQADITVLTNIGTSHIEHYPNRLAIAEEKAEIYSAQLPGGPLFINGEDPYLLEIAREACTTRPVYIVYTGGKGAFLRTVLAEDQAIMPSNEENIHALSAVLSQYRGSYRFPGIPSGTIFLADKIVESKEGLKFDFVQIFGDQKKTWAQVTLPKASISTAQNALFALAITQVMGLDIVPSVENLRALKLTDGRQQVEEVTNHNLLIDDCYNASPESMKAAFHLLDKLGESAEYTQKVAVIGGVKELGEYAEALHQDIGRSLGRYHLDHYYLLGEWGETMSEAIREVDPDALIDCFNEQDQLIDRLAQARLQDTIILVKASRGYKMEASCDAIRKGFM